MIFKKTESGIIVGYRWGRLAILSLMLLLSPFLLLGSWFTVAPGYVSVLTRAGALVDADYSEGFHLKLPLVDSPSAINIQQVTWEHKGLDAGTADMQQLTASVATNSSIDPIFAREVYRNFRDSDRLAAQILFPAVEETLKATTSKYRSEEIIAKRQQINAEFIAGLRERVKPFHLIVNQVSITNLTFSPEFMKSIEAKVTAEQRSLQAKHDLARIKTEGEQRIATATAEAQAIKVQAEAITKNGGAEYVQLKAIDKWNGVLPTTNAAGAVPFLNLK